MSSLSLHASASLQATLSPRLQRAVRLLQMSSLDFAQVVRDALETNPFLEQEAHAAPTVDEPRSQAEPDPGQAETWGMDGMRRMRKAEGESAVFDTLECATTLSSHLLGQLSVMPLSQRDQMLAFAVVESLDDDGYLRMPLLEVTDGLGLLPRARPQELKIALRRVQALDPAGVGARSVAECLELQLPCVADADVRALAGVIVREHLEALAGRDTRALIRRTGFEPQAVEAACAAIRRLNPHPGWRHGAAAVQYVTAAQSIPNWARICRRHAGRCATSSSAFPRS